MIRRLSRGYSSSVDGIFETLLNNIMLRHGENKKSVYKSVLDLRDDHFKFQPHQVDLVLSKVGDLGKSVADLDPYLLAVKMIANGQKRGSVVYNKEKSQMQVSHPVLNEVAEMVEKWGDKAFPHEGVFFEVGRRSNALMGAFVWNSNRGQPIGGLQLLKYNSVGDYVKDGLFLSSVAGRQSSLSKIWAGGGAGIIACPPGNVHLEEGYRKKIFQDYGEFLTSLRGIFVSSQGVGVYPLDMDTIFSKSRFVTNLSYELGGPPNYHQLIAQGAVSSMEAALDFHQMGGLENKRVVVQGVGSNGSPIVSLLIQKKVEKVICTDASEKIVNESKSKFKGLPVEVRHVPLGDTSIFGEPCDIFSPNALPQLFTEQSVVNLKTKIVCGSTLNQLSNISVEKKFIEQGICYIPDFVVNLMSAVLSWDELSGSFPNDPNILKYVEKSWDYSIYNLTKQILQIARDHPNMTPSTASNQLADRFLEELHPIHGNKFQTIISYLKTWHNLKESTK